MKKITFLALSLVCSAFILSCDKDKDDVQKDMAADEQKSFLEDVAVEFTQKVPASEFEQLKAFAEDISYIFDDYSWTVVGDSLKGDLNKGLTREVERYIDSISSPGEYIYCTDVSVRVLLAMSNFTGHFTAQDNGWVYSESDNLEFEFKDANEKTCLLKIAKEGKETSFSIPEIEDEDLDYNGRNYNYYYEVTDVVVVIPEKIIVSLSQEGKDVVKATYTPNLSNLTGDGYFDIGKTNLLMGVDFELNNGYKFSFKTEESPNKKLSVNCNLSNSAGELIAYTASTDPSGIPSFVLDNMVAMEELEETLQNSEDLNAKNMYMSLSVLKKAQIIGRIADYKEIASLAERMNMKAGEAEYRKALDEFNSKLDLGLYYNGSTKKQASLQLELKVTEVVEQGREGEHWQIIPVMVFSDGARISCEEFFDEKGFTKAIEAFDALQAQYEDLFGDEEK